MWTRWSGIISVMHTPCIHPSITLSPPLPSTPPRYRHPISLFNPPHSHTRSTTQHVTSTTILLPPRSSHLHDLHFLILILERARLAQRPCWRVVDGQSRYGVDTLNLTRTISHTLHLTHPSHTDHHSSVVSGAGGKCGRRVRVLRASIFLIP